MIQRWAKEGTSSNISTRSSNRVQGPEDEDRYFRESEGIELDKAMIQKKLWSKITEPSKMFDDPQELFRFLATPCIDVTIFLSAADEVVWVTWKRKKIDLHYGTQMRQSGRM
jgi:hypothetical protein